MAETITIFCKNTNLYREVPIGSTLNEIYSLVGEPLAYPPMNAQVNHKTESLNYRCWQPQDIAYVDYTHLSGMRTYVRSLCHLFSKAVHDLWPEATLNLEHPVSRGYYCVIHGEQPIDEAAIARLKARMQALVDADLPFVHHRVQTPEAVRLFKQRGMEEKVRLLESAGMVYTSYYELDGYINFFYGCLTPSTGSIQLFDIVPYKDGLLRRVPRRDDPTQLEPIVPQDKMFGAYKEHLTLQRTVE